MPLLGCSLGALLLAWQAATNIHSSTRVGATIYVQWQIPTWKGSCSAVHLLTRLLSSAELMLFVCCVRCLVRCVFFLLTVLFAAMSAVAACHRKCPW